MVHSSLHWLVPGVTGDSGRLTGELGAVPGGEGTPVKGRPGPTQCQVRGKRGPGPLAPRHLSDRPCTRGAHCLDTRRGCTPGSPTAGPSAPRSQVHAAAMEEGVEEETGPKPFKGRLCLSCPLVFPVCLKSSLEKGAQLGDRMGYLLEITTQQGFTGLLQLPLGPTLDTRAACLPQPGCQVGGLAQTSTWRASPLTASRAPQRPRAAGAEQGVREAAAQGAGRGWRGGRRAGE